MPPAARYKTKCIIDQELADAEACKYDEFGFIVIIIFIIIRAAEIND